MVNGSFFKSVYFWSFSVMVLGRLQLLGIAASFWVCLFVGFVKCNYEYVRSLVMDGSISFLWICPSTEYNIHSLTHTAAHIYDTVSVFTAQVNTSQSIPDRCCWLRENLQVITRYNKHIHSSSLLRKNIKLKDKPLSR